jgi:hypothetical protein
MADRYITFPSFGFSFDYCSFSSNGNMINSGANLQLTNCTIQEVLEVTGAGCAATNCVFKSVIECYALTKTNCQTSWVPPAEPVWNAERSAFLASTLSARIVISAPFYTGVGLWRTPRTGIGAMDFPLKNCSSFLPFFGI